ncbi:hypothetical protein OSB04_032165, partial [Centaurea solstitialis]
MATVFPAATSTSTATTAGILPLLPTVTTTARCSAVPNLPARSFSTSLKRVSESKRSSLFKIKASEDASAGADPNELLTDLQEKWDALENKSTVIIYGGGGIVAIWLSSILIGAINSVPLLPKIMELVGLGYTGWFVYRYLLFKSSRKELATDIESIKKKIAGTERHIWSCNVWDALENKSTIIIYRGRGIVAICLSSILIGAILGVHGAGRLSKIMELVGLGYTGWFVYRHMLFK